uniref:Uncharacterized protein n=1 Tax=Oryza brachyantha TaxID=4533 RepID=J3MU16_ORYBR
MHCLFRPHLLIHHTPLNHTYMQQTNLTFSLSTIQALSCMSTYTYVQASRSTLHATTQTWPPLQASNVTVSKQTLARRMWRNREK